MTYETIEIEIKEKIATLWLNRPEVHNAFNDIMLAELISAFDEFNNNSEILCIILRGRGKSFCAGVDLNWMREVAKNDYEQNYSESLVLSKCFYKIYTCNKPTIAVVHGVALGGANGLVSACDLAYCVDDATFSLSEVKIGIVPACISPYVIKRIGEYGSKDLMISGRRINGKEAEYLRLVNKSVSLDNLDEVINQSIKHIRTSGPAAMTHCKNLIYKVTNDLNLLEAYDFTAKIIAEIRASDEGQEGMASFLEKRKPKWVKE